MAAGAGGGPCREPGAWGMGTDATTIALGAIQQSTGAVPGTVHRWNLDLGVVTLACAAALFLVAGVLRLARWRLVQ